MSIIDIRCYESTSSTNDCCCLNKNKESVFIGNDFVTYLYFNLPISAYSNHLKQARLILFKLPEHCIDNQTAYQNTQYSIYPLLEFFNIYSCMFSAPEIDCKQRIIYEENDCCCSYIEIDITSIVNEWIGNRIENKGLRLEGNKNTRLITYASDKYPIEGMRPLLRLIYDGYETCQPLSSAECTVEVDS